MKHLISKIAIAMFALAILPVAASHAQTYDEQTSHLFHNMYTGGAASQATAGMYPAPHPTPRIAGHVFYTYQPLMPHQMMYEHNRTYYTTYAGPEAFYSNPCSGPNCLTPYGGAGVNKTTVIWQHGGTFATPYPFSIHPLQNLRHMSLRH